MNKYAVFDVRKIFLHDNSDHKSWDNKETELHEGIRIARFSFCLRL